MTAPYISITGLQKSYSTPTGPLEVLKNIDLDIQRGDFIALVGPSGSGKTTFLNMITGVDAPTSGIITIDGMDITRASQREMITWRARHIGIVFQLFQLLPTVSVLDNVIAPMDFARVWKPKERKAIAQQLLDYVGIGDQGYKKPAMLSGGQQQQVAIARALANNPPLFIGDELTANLDHMSARAIFDLLHKLAQRGTTVIVVTHDRELVQDVPVVLELVEGTLRPCSKEAEHRTTNPGTRRHPTQSGPWNRSISQNHSMREYDHAHRSSGVTHTSYQSLQNQRGPTQCAERGGSHHQPRRVCRHRRAIW